MSIPKGPDEILYAPASEIALSSPVGLRKNATRRKISYQEQEEKEALSLYNGHEGLLVRTALIRTDKYAKGKERLPSVSSSSSVYKLCQHLVYADQEYMVVLAVNGQMEVVAIHEAAKGGSSSSQTEAAHILKVLFLTGAHGLILVHNHPGGRPTPSNEDLALTKKLKGVLDCSGKQLLDHVIVAREGFYSFLDHDMI